MEAYKPGSTYKAGEEVTQSGYIFRKKKAGKSTAAILKNGPVWLKVGPAPAETPKPEAPKPVTPAPVTPTVDPVVKELETKLAAAAKEKANLQKKVTELTATLNETHAKLEDTEEARIAAEKKHSETLEQIAELEKQIEDLSKPDAPAEPAPVEPVKPAEPAPTKPVETKPKPGPIVNTKPAPVETVPEQPTPPSTGRKSGKFDVADYEDRLMSLVGAKSNADPYRKIFTAKDTEKVTLTWTRVSDPVIFTMLFPKEMEFRLERLRMWDTYGAITDYPTKFFFVPRDKDGFPDFDNQVAGPVYDGAETMKWVDYTLPKPIDLYAIKVEVGAAMPKIEPYGSWIPYQPTPFKNKNSRIRDHISTNGYVWNVVAGNSRGFQTEKAELFKAFTGGRVRDYFDWSKLEVKEGEYTFAPTPDGGWDYDVYYQFLHENDIEILTCLKNNTGWSLDKFYGIGKAKNRELGVGHWTKLPEPVKPASTATEAQKTKYNKDLAAYRTDMDLVRRDKESYRQFCEAAFQIVARYGSNKNIDPNLVKPANGQDRIPAVANPSIWKDEHWKKNPDGTFAQAKKYALGYVKKIGCDNENDATWHGEKRYMRPEWQAMLMSVFYDGHKNTMGAGIGVKNADPNIIVVSTGIASNRPDYFVALMEEFIKIRGYKIVDGKKVVDVPCDAWEYHAYANKGGGQDVDSEGGLPPELSNMAWLTPQFTQTIAEYGEDKDTVVGETGYGLNDGKQQAVATPTRTKEQTQADWIIRTIHHNARHGVAETYFYQSYDETDYINALAWNPEHKDYGPYAALGLIHERKKKAARIADGKPVLDTKGNQVYDLERSELRRRFALDYMMQLAFFKDYRYSKTLHSDPFVDEYELAGKKMWALMVPDMVSRTADYTLEVGAAEALVYTFVDGAEKFAVKTVKTNNGKLTLTVTETPMYVTPG